MHLENQLNLFIL